MQVKLAVVADYANVSSEGKLNILGIFDRINVSDLPAAHPQMHLILRLEAHSTDASSTRQRTKTLEMVKAADYERPS